MEITFEVSSSTVIVIDSRDRIMMWPTPAVTLFGWSQEEALRMSIYDVIIEFESMGIHKNGTRFPVTLSLNPFKTPEASFTVVSVHEPTKIQEQVNQLNRELEQTRLQLKYAKKDLDTFCYSASHDLRAPLRAINSYTRLLAEELEQDLTDDTRKMMQSVLNNTKRMARLIDDLLAFSRLSKKELSKTLVNMDELVQSLVLDIKAASPGLKTDFFIKPLIPARGDYHLIIEVFTHLISNSIKYSSKTKEPSIEIGSYEEGEDAIYYVKDNGVGFDMKYYHKLFGVFERLHGNDEFEGTGVGLAIVHRIIQRHGGMIWAESMPGGGATFYFSLQQQHDLTHSIHEHEFLRN